MQQMIAMNDTSSYPMKTSSGSARLIIMKMFSHASWTIADAGHHHCQQGHPNHYSHHHKVSVTSDKIIVVDMVCAGNAFNVEVFTSLHNQKALTKTIIADFSITNIHNALTLEAQVKMVTVSRAVTNPPWWHGLV